jgi:glutathione S-transferase
LGRRLLWPGLKRRPEAMVGYSERSQLQLPAAMVRMSAPLLTRLAVALNRASDDAARADMRALPGYLDRVDAWIAEGVLAGEPPNAADLQIASTLRLLMSVADLRPLIEGRPAGALARRLFEEVDGELPVGTYPAEWLPVAA